MDDYFIQWKSPKPRWHVIRKTLWDHGFFPLFAVVVILMTWVGLNINWNDLRPLSTLIFLVALELIILNDFRGFYFQCDKEEESMKGKD